MKYSWLPISNFMGWSTLGLGYVHYRLRQLHRDEDFLRLVALDSSYNLQLYILKHFMKLGFLWSYFLWWAWIHMGYRSWLILFMMLNHTINYRANFKSLNMICKQSLVANSQLNGNSSSSWDSQCVTHSVTRCDKVRYTVSPLKLNERNIKYWEFTDRTKRFSCRERLLGVDI